MYIETYYDKKLSKNYIIVGNLIGIKSYDYNENKIYKKYIDNDANHNKRYKSHSSIIINYKNEIIEMIESSYDGNIRVWNFNSGELLKKYMSVRKI